MVYTVIGLYDDTAQVLAEHIHASDPYEAMQLAARNSETPGALQILGVLTGEHQLIAACEDSGKAAHAPDLLE